MTYTIIAYKPSNNDCCRGCLMNSYSSEFEYEITDSNEQAIQIMAAMYQKNSHVEEHECNYEIILLFNGKEPGSTWIEREKRWNIEEEEEAKVMQLKARAVANCKEDEIKTKV